MAGASAFLWQLAKVLILAVTFALTLWQRRRKPKSVSFVVPIGIAAVLAVTATIFLRQVDSIHRLKSLDPGSVSSFVYKGRSYRDQQAVSAIARALNQTEWWSARSSAMVEHAPFTIHLRDGSDWTLAIGANRYGQGIVIEMADHELSRGYGFNSQLGEVLQQH